MSCLDFELQKQNMKPNKNKRNKTKQNKMIQLDLLPTKMNFNFSRNINKVSLKWYTIVCYVLKKEICKT